MTQKYNERAFYPFNVTKEANGRDYQITTKGDFDVQGELTVNGLPLSGGGSNFAIADLTFTGDRLHDLGTFSLKTTQASAGDIEFNSTVEADKELGIRSGNDVLKNAGFTGLGIGLEYFDTSSEIVGINYLGDATPLDATGVVFMNRLANSDSSEFNNFLGLYDTGQSITVIENLSLDSAMFNTDIKGANDAQINLFSTSADGTATNKFYALASEDSSLGKVEIIGGGNTSEVTILSGSITQSDILLFSQSDGNATFLNRVEGNEASFGIALTGVTAASSQTNFIATGIGATSQYAILQDATLGAASGQWKLIGSAQSDLSFVVETDATILANQPFIQNMVTASHIDARPTIEWSISWDDGATEYDLKFDPIGVWIGNSETSTDYYILPLVKGDEGDGLILNALNTMEWKQVAHEDIPSYATTAAGVAALNSGQFFKVTNGDGSAAIHIVE